MGKDEDWSHINDPAEKRRAQLRNSQRRHRAKKKDDEDEQKRNLQNLANAGSAYTSPGADQLDGQGNVSGLPWGSYQLSYMSQGGEHKKSSSSQQGGSLTGGTGGSSSADKDKSNKSSKSSKSKGATKDK